jgi:hypothetical protein
MFSPGAAESLLLLIFNLLWPHRTMKKFLLLIAITIAVLATPANSQAQVYAYAGPGQVPSWGPAGHAQVRYYYLPDLQMYYEVPTAQFIFFNRGHWVATRHLPPVYRSYNLHAGPKVMLRYNGPYPYEGFGVHRQRYPRGYCAPHTVYVFPEPAPYGPSPRWRHPGHEYYYEDGYRYDRRDGQRQEGYDRRNDYDARPEPDYRRSQPREYEDQYRDYDRRPDQQQREENYPYDQEEQYSQPERRDTDRRNDNQTPWRYRPLGTD